MNVTNTHDHNETNVKVEHCRNETNVTIDYDYKETETKVEHDHAKPDNVDMQYYTEMDIEIRYFISKLDELFEICSVHDKYYLDRYQVLACEFANKLRDWRILRDSWDVDTQKRIENAVTVDVRSRIVRLGEKYEKSAKDAISKIENDKMNLLQSFVVKIKQELHDNNN